MAVPDTEAESASTLIDTILHTVNKVAVVGLSDDPARPSYGVARTLVAAGYQVVGVNPSVKKVAGIVCYPSLADLPDKPDLVDVFRRPDAIDALVDDVIGLGIEYLWLQEGVVNEVAVRRAREAGVKVIMDRCMAKELNFRGWHK